MGKNDFLRKQAERDRKFFMAGMDMGVQLAHDYIQIALRDKPTMAKDVFGRERIERVLKKVLSRMTTSALPFLTMWKRITAALSWIRRSGRFGVMILSPLRNGIQWPLPSGMTRRRRDGWTDMDGRNLGKGVRFERIRRITGYLVGTMDRWNNAKKAEEKDRVKHGMKDGRNLQKEE